MCFCNSVNIGFPSGICVLLRVGKFLVPESKSQPAQRQCKYWMGDWRSMLLAANRRRLTLDLILIDFVEFSIVAA